MEAKTGTAAAGKPTAAAQEERLRFEDFTHRDAWLIRKENTVERFGHSSMYLWELNEMDHRYEELKQDPALAVCGGAFPIIVQGEIRGMAAVSGLAHYEDHQLLTEALEELRAEKEEQISECGENQEVAG